MAGFQDYLDQFVSSNTSEALPQPVQPVVPNPADAAALAQATNDPTAALMTNLAMDRGNVLATDNEIITDFQNMPLWDFQGKYGADITAQMGELSQANQELHRLESSERSIPARVGDFGIGVGTGLVGGVGDAATLVGGALNRDVGAWGSEVTTSFRDWMNENQSVSNQQNRVLAGLRAELDGQDNAAQFEQDKETQSDFVAGLSYLGRGFVNGAARFYEDPQSLESGLSEGVGSLLAGGPIARGIGLVGKLAGAGRAATSLTMPAAIGMMEGGSAYSGAMQEVMNMSNETLLVNSPTYRELVASGMDPDEAKEQVAARAAEIAATIQAPVGAITGRLVSGFEANPLGSKGFRDMIKNILNETIEEGAQSASGQTAQNLGIQLTADENQDILENVGDQTAQGAILGSLTAGVVQAPAVPGAALNQAATALRERAAAIQAANEAGSGVTEADLRAAADVAVENLAPVAEAADTLAQSVPEDIRADVGADTFRSRIEAISNVEENEIRSLGRNTIQYFAENGIETPNNRGSLIMSTARAAMDPTAPAEVRTAAGLFLMEEMDRQSKLFDEDLNEAMASMEQESNEYRALSEYQNLMAQLRSSKNIAGALDWVRENAKVEVSENADPQTVLNAIRATTSQPSSLGSKSARTILKQADEGSITVTPEQRKAFRNTAETLEIAEQAMQQIAQADQQADYETESVKDVAEQVMTRGRQEDWGLSIDQHVARINTAIQRGDTTGATAALRHFGNFAASQRNKAQAALRSVQQGGEQTFARVGAYGKRNPVDGRITIHANSPGSLALARRVTLEANMLIDQVNALMDANPETGITQRLERLSLPVEFFGQQQAQPAQQSEPREETAQPTTETETPPSEAVEPIADNTEQRVRDLIEDGLKLVEDGQIELTVNDEVIQDWFTNSDIEFTSVGNKIYIDENIARDFLNNTITETVPVTELTEFAEPVDIEVNTAVETRSTLEQKFPLLVKAKEVGNRFLQAFSGEKTGRFLDYGEPIVELRDALNTNFTDENFLFQGEQTEALQDYLDKGLDLIDGKNGLAHRLREFANSPWEKNNPDSIKMGQKIIAGDDVAGLVRGHAIAILEKAGNKYQYNPALIQTAVLASLHWFAGSQNREAYVTKEDVAKLTGLDISEIPNKKLEEFQAGVGLTQAVRGLSETINQFWGLEANKDAPENLVRGIPEAIAKEILEAMEAKGWMSSGDITIPGKTEKFKQYYFGENISSDIRTMLREMGPARKVIELAGLRNEDRTGATYETPPERVAPTQMRNKAVRNTKAQRAVIRKVQAIPHYFYRNSYEMQRSIGADAWIELMGSTVIGENTPFNEEHLKSVKGKNLTIQQAFDAMEYQVSELEGYATKHKINDLENIKKYYQFNYSRVDRLQMLGVNNPQSDKIARHVFLPTKATLDLTDDTSAHSLGFWMAMAQGLGVKTQHFTREENAQQGRALVSEGGKFFPLVQELQSWLKSENRPALADWAKRLRQVDPGITEHGIMSLLSAAEYANAAETGSLKEFVTHNYFEADGVTNGAANALMNLTTEVSADWINTVMKAGAFIGREGTAMNIQRGKNDLYQEAGNALAEMQKHFINNLPDDAREVHDALFRIMRGLGMKISFENGEIRIDRKVLKNPLTITIYGSGIDGIAGNVASEMMDMFYEALSDHLQSGKASVFGEDMVIEGKPYSATQFWGDLNHVLNNVVVNNDNNFSVEKAKFAKNMDGIPSNAALKKLAISPTEFRTLRDNVRALFVDNMDAAIKQTVMGHVGGMVDNIQKSTNAQSIVMNFMFRKEVLKAMADRQVNPDKYPGYRRGDFLSQTELDAILKRLMPYGAVINTEYQSFFLGSGERSDLMPSTEIKVGDKTIKVTMPESYSRTLFGQLKTAAYAYAPSIAGVAGVPSFNIGTGDGRMIDVFLQNLKGFGVLPVFDGINLPTDRVFEGSQMANGAVMQSWTENPAKYAAESFKAFLALNPLEQMFDPADPFNVEMDKLAYELTKNVEGVRQPAQALSQTDLNMQLEDLMQRLDVGQQQIGDRIAALKQMPMSVDQMAGGQTPYTQKGTVRLPANPTATQIATALEHQMKVVAAARTKGEAISGPSREFVAAFRSKAGTDPDTGALVAGVEALDAIRKTLNNKLSNAHREMLNAALSSLSDSGLTVVFGTPEMVDRYEQNNYPNTYLGDGSNYLGKIDVENNVIFLTNPSAETLAHELIHAATITKMQGYYADKSSVSVADGEAIVRLEGLMKEWLARSYEREGPAVSEAHRMAVSSIMNFLNQNRMPEALNEFLAWSLTNQNIINLQKKMQVQNPLYRIMGEALSALKRLIWGHKKAPAVGTDMFSNVRFNARVLMATPTPIELFMRDFGDVVMYQSASFGTDARLSEVRRRFGEQLVSFVRTAQTNDTVKNAAGYITRRQDALEALLRHASIANAMAVPFKMDMQQISTFKMIGATLTVAEHLNGASLARMNEIYSAVIDKLSPADFLYNDGRDAQLDEYQAQEKYKALTGVGTTGFDKKGRSSQLANFIALATVDPQLRTILRGMEFPARIMDKSWTADALFERAGAAVASGLANYASGQGKADIDLLAAMDALTQNLIENIGDQRSFIEQRVDNGLDNADNIIKTYIEKGAKKAEAWGKTLQSPLGQKASKFLTILSRSLTEEGTKSLNRTTVSFMNQPEIKNAQREVINEIIGRTDENAPVFDMVTRARTFVDQTRQRWREEYPRELRKRFSRKLTNQEWADLHMGLGKTDAAVLFQTYRRDRTLELLSLGSERVAEIRILEAKLSAPVIAKAKQLATSMVTGAHGSQLQRNAHAIAVLNNARESETDIDNLVSLYALEYSPENVRKTLENLIENESEGFAQVFHSLVATRNDEMAKATTGIARMNAFKGKLDGLNQDGVHLVIDSRQNHADYMAMGYVELGDYVGSSADIGTEKKAYYFAPVSGRAKFNQGVMQTVQQSVFGVNPDTGFSVGMLNAGRITDPRAVNAISKRIQNQRSTTENLLPVYGENGRVIGYERAADPMKMSNLNPVYDLAAALGAWRGRQSEEMSSRAVNEELVNRVYNIWMDGRREHRTSEFVDMSRSTDPVISDAWSVIPRETKEYIKAKFGQDGFKVRRDMLLDVAGARSASVGDFWTGNSRWSPAVQKEIRDLIVGFGGNKAYRYLVNAEELLQQVVTDAKVLIVVKSMIVPAANFISNIYQLSMNGVPMRNIFKGFKEKTYELNTYIKNREIERQLQNDLFVAEGANDSVNMRKLSARLQALRDSYKSLTIWPLLEAGEFGAITEGGISQEDLAIAKGGYAALIDKIANKMPDGIKDVARYGLVTRDTALFKALSRATQYGDFLGKAILYDDLLRRKNMSQTEALAYINEEFINYNRFAGRNRAYLESMGMMWFYNFKLRSMKVAQRMMHKHPLRALLHTALMPRLPFLGSVGNPITDNMLAVITDGRLGYSLGPGMLFRAPQLNPWVSMVD